MLARKNVGFKLKKNSRTPPGLPLCRRLRAMEGREDLPVIFVTAEGDVEMESKGAAMGGIDYVTKPIQREVLLALVRSRLQR